MSYEQFDELRALFEILEVCEKDLKELLTRDHSPADLLERIDKDRQTIDDINYLIADMKAQIAARQLHKIAMREYSMVHSMSRLSV